MAPFTSCLKGLFYIFNFVFWISGLALLVVGIMMKFTFAYFMKLSTDVNYNLAPYIMIGCGVFIILVGLCGCWATAKQHGWALKVYIFILVILVIVEMAGAITGYVLRNKMSSGLENGMENAVKNYYTDKDFKSAMDEVQGRYVHCCGVDSYKDYFTKPAPNTTLAPTTVAPVVNTTMAPLNTTTAPRNTTATTNATVIATTLVTLNTTAAFVAPTNQTRRRRRSAPSSPYSVPMSCCKNSDGKDCHYKNLQGLAEDKMGIHLNGCYDSLLVTARKNFAIVGGVALGIALFQILGVVCAYLLTKKFKESSNYEQM